MNMQEIQLKNQLSPVKIPDFVSVLIVDDQRFDRARLRRICDDLDFEVSVTEADSLVSMGEALGLDKFDLIFLDFNMPDGNGLQALDAIHFDDHNRLAAVIMVTGIDDSDTAIAAMKHGCSDFIKKDAVSVSSVRRATINALQKASLNRGLETQTVMRSNIETVLDQFTKQCAEEFRPMLFNMMRHVRNLHTVRLDEDKYNTALKRIEISCGRLFDFMEDIEEKDRKDEAFSEFNNDRFQSDVAAVPVKQAPKRKTLFGQRA